MKAQVSKYNIEKTKNFLKKKKLLCFLTLDTYSPNNFFNNFCGKTNFVKFLIKTSVFRRVLHFINNKSLLICLDITKKLNSKLKLQKNTFFLFLKNKIYSLTQLKNLILLKFSNLFLHVKLSLKFLADFKIIIKFFKEFAGIFHRNNVV